MKHGICLISTAAMRLHPDHKSEMVSQLLFGETFFVLERSGSWLYIEMLHDHYQGWVAINQVMLVEDHVFEELEMAEKMVSGQMLEYTTEAGQEERFLVSGGSTFYVGRVPEMPVNGKRYRYEGMLVNPKKSDQDDICRYAREFLHTPYLWGGRSAYGFDCSGFVQVVFKMAGVVLPRDASIQANQGEHIHLIHESQPGDLVFFDDAEETITHVGILLGDGHVIHAHGKVRIDNIDHQGIFNRETGTYSHPLRLIKRISLQPVAPS